MDNRNQKLRYTVEHALPWIVLAVLSIYTYAKFFEHPYTGFRWDITGQVVAIYVPDLENDLAIGDQLIQIDDLSWQEFRADLRKTILDHAQKGDIVPFIIERSGEQMTILIELPGPNQGEILDLLINEGWLSFVFWLTGTLTLLLLRPKNERWILLILFNYLTAIWLGVGSGPSFYHIWGSSILMRMTIWLCVPVYLHLHWVYPKPFKKLPSQIIWGVYLAATMLAVAEWFQLPDPGFYALGFLLAISGSLLLLLAHTIWQPETRRDLRLFLLAVVLALVPAIILGIISASGTWPAVAGAGMIGLPFLPLTYFYALYRRQLGQSELRVNRLISVYIFLMLLGILVFPLFAWSAQFQSPIYIVSVAALLSVFTTILAIFGFPRFQSFVEQRVLHISLPPENLQEIYSARITTSATRNSLLHLLKNEILPSLLVRQFAFLQADNHSLKVLLTVGKPPEQLPGDKDFTLLIELAGKYRSPEILGAEQPFPWVYLSLPLKVGNTLIGFWLFGRRDPDDMYPQSEISTLQSLANQTAIALSNILQTERLRAMYLANVDRYEEERLHLALELHDSILNQMAVLMMNMDAHNPTAKFQEAYDDLTQRLREIVSDLRPPMLNYGLEPAIRELADNLMERSKDTIQIDMDIQSDGNRYPEKIELHLFRIVQEACENALRHAQAKNITISGHLFFQEIDLSLRDDGVGFEAGENLQLDVLITNKHFGLVGMGERAAIIGAEVKIESIPEKGTKIQITWKQDPA